MKGTQWDGKDGIKASGTDRGLKMELDSQGSTKWQRQRRKDGSHGMHSKRANSIREFS